MPTEPLVQLETTIKQLPGVLGCVILASPDGSAAEIQAFIRVGIAREAVEGLIASEIERVGLGDRMTSINVFELDAESVVGDRESLQRAAGVAAHEVRSEAPQIVEEPPILPEPWTIDKGLGRRPTVQRVVLSATSQTSEAEVELGDVVGTASGEKTLHGLAVVGQATLRACKMLVADFDVELLGASLVSVVGHEAVMVLVRVGSGQHLLGSALLRDGPASEATVRATLDAVNRLLLRTA